MSKWHGGKGSAQRPSTIDRTQWEENYHKIFGYKDKQKCLECGEIYPMHTNKCAVKDINKS